MIYIYDIVYVQYIYIYIYEYMYISIPHGLKHGNSVDNLWHLVDL